MDTGHRFTLFAATHLLPQQKDIAGILHVLRFCSARMPAPDQIGLIVEKPLQDHLRLFLLDAAENTVETIRTGPGDAAQFCALCRQTEITVLDRESCGLPPLLRDRILLLPLPVDVHGYHCALFFARHDDGPDPEDRTGLRILSAVTAATLSAVLTVEEMSMETRALRRERDQLALLVGVSNVISSTLDLPTIITRVFADLRRFLGISCLAVELNDSETVSGTVSVTACSGMKSVHTQIPGKDALLATAIPGSPHECAERSCADPALSLITEDMSVWSFPMTVHDSDMGVLILAHERKDFFTHEITGLVTQIARSLAGAVRNAREYTSVTTELHSVLEENLYLSQEISEQREQGDIIGRSRAIREVMAEVDLVAQTDSTVLLLGESGTGKEVVSEAIHRRSRRAAGRLFRINCAAVPAGLLESELFGHEKGAYTGAVSRSRGRFELAHGSTLLLDEIGDMPLELQPKLLRVLQEREIERLGGSGETIRVDVRVIAATNQDLAQMVEDRRFRSDLFYRLNVFPICLPPLRERREDIPLLARHFTGVIARRMKKTITRIPIEGLRWLSEQDWPGNVRELANVIERAVIITSGSVLCLTPDLSVPWGKTSVPADTDNAGSSETATIIRAVTACNGVIGGSRGAAVLLGLKRTTLLSRMKRLGLSVRDIMDNHIRNRN